MKLFTEYKKEDQFSIFSNVSPVKRFASLFIIISMIVYIWLQSKEVTGINIQGFNSLNFKLIVLSIALMITGWRVTSMSLRNSIISLGGRHVTYFYSFALILYIYLITYLKVFETDVEWKRLINVNYLWVLPIYAFGPFWKLSNFFLEYKIRKYYAIQELWKALLELSLISVVLISWWILDKYKFNNNSLSDTYLDKLNLFIFFMLGFSFVGIEISFWKIFLRRRFTISEKKALKAIFWPKTLVISFIMFISFITAISGSGIELMDAPYISTVVALIVFILMISSTRKETSGKSKLYLLVFSVTLLLMSILLLVFNLLLNASIGVSVAAFLGGILALMAVNNITKPEIGAGSGRILMIFLGFTAIFAIAVYILYMAGFASVFNSSALPFNLLELLELIPIVSSASIVLIKTTILYIHSRKLSKSLSKLIKLEKREEAVNV